MLDTIFGLPTHALVVHATVVLLPLAALGAVIIVLRRSLIHRLGLLTVLLALVGTAAAWVSLLSGEELASRVGYPDPHHDLGENLAIHATIFFVLVTIYWLLARGVPGNRSRPWWLIIYGVVVAIAAVGLTWSTIITGHSGAEAVWKPIVDNTQPGQFQED